MRIPQEKIEDVRSATDIVDLIGGFIQLKKRGKNYVGLCPFHSEKTPSFNVSPDRQMYHCFGCGVGGNAITFVMEFEKVSFLEAVRSLAERAGITLPTGSDSGEASEQEELYETCRLAAEYFHRLLVGSQEGKLALEYLRHRGFTDATIEEFMLGASPGSWTGLTDYFRDKGIPAAGLEKAGLARKREDGSLYDYFRGRAMFPVQTTTGRVVGFGARKMLEDDPLGKYINSPETLIYNKSRILYGIYRSKEAIRSAGSAILVEGYADLITAYQDGVRNIVASSGTALTQDQVKLVARYAGSLTIVYDADAAGVTAASRGIDIVLENGLDVKIAVLPEGEDPDSFVRKNGGKRFQQIVDGSDSFVDYIARRQEEAGKLRTPEGQAESVRLIIQAIGHMSDELKRNFYIKHVAERYKLYESTLYRELEKTLGTLRRPARAADRSAGGGSPGRGEMKGARPPLDPVAGIPAVEVDLIHSMLDGGRDVVTLFFDQLAVDDLTHPSSRTIVRTIARQVEEEGVVNPSVLIEAFEDPLQREAVASILFSKYQLSDGWSESQRTQADPRTLAADAIRRFRELALDRSMKENMRRMKEAGARGEDLTPFQKRNQEFLRELGKLKAVSPPKTPDQTAGE